MENEGRILNIEDFLPKPKPANVFKWVEEIPKDEFTSFRIKKEKNVLNKRYLLGLYDIDNS